MRCTLTAPRFPIPAPNRVNVIPRDQSARICLHPALCIQLALRSHLRVSQCVSVEPANNRCPRSKRIADRRTCSSSRIESPLRILNDPQPAFLDDRDGHVEFERDGHVESTLDSLAVIDSTLPARSY